MQKEENDLRDRTKEFALRVIRMFSTLPKSFEAQHLGKQVLRSGTFVGANYREAHRGRSKAEFIAKCGDSLRELDETAYWFELLMDGGIVPATKVSALRQECDELTAILVTILKRSKERLNMRNQNTNLHFFIHPSAFLLGICVLLTGCASAPLRTGQGGAATPPYPGRADLPVRHSGSEQVKQRLDEIINAVETKDFPRLDSYHWYGPHFTKFASKGQRLDAAAAREGEHKGLSALAGLKLRAEDLQIDVFDDTAVATFTSVATIGGIGGASSASPQSNPITKRERGTLIFVKHEGSWKIVHEHFSAAE
jgi:four helix bundle protein